MKQCPYNIYNLMTGLINMCDSKTGTNTSAR